jgi:hypothetical protein
MLPTPGQLSTIHLQMAFMRRTPSLAIHVAIARSSVMALTLFARDVLRVAIKAVSTGCENNFYLVEETLQKSR